MSVKARFEGKRVLITGTTGFLGKVLLEKILFSLSCVDRVYVLIRAKDGSNLHERFKKEIVSSACFDRLRQQHRGKFDDFIQQKVVPMYHLRHSDRATCKRKDSD
jgi:alcohol-forming fatty acyl-CoA reductase